MKFSQRKVKQLLMVALCMAVALSFVLLGATPAFATDNIGEDASGSVSFSQPASASSAAPEDTLQQDSQTESVPAPAENMELIPGSIGGYVWLDANEDGEIGAQEAAVANIKVALFAGGNKAEPVAETQTDENGNYTFAGLEPGEYSVGMGAQTINSKEYLIPIKAMQPGVGNQFDVDWESDPIFSYTEWLAVEEGGAVTGVNAGLRAGGQIMPLSGTYYVTNVTASTPATGPYGTLAAAVGACTIANKYIIEVRAHDTNMDVSSFITIPASIDITLTSDSGGPYTITQQNAERHFKVNGSLTLSNIVLQGMGNPLGTGYNGSVEVNAGGSLTMEQAPTEVTKITGCNGYLGGAVYLEGGTFTMNGGSIASNVADAGGGVYARGNNPVIAMYGGSISNNTAQYAGGGIEINSGTGQLTMYGGNISGNTVTSGDGGGAVVNTASINLVNGTISGNTASASGGGLRLINTTLTMAAGTIDGNIANSGAGIHLTQSTATINGGSITGNEASAAGGGVYATDGSTFSMYTGSAISDNTATSAGGGIEISSSSGVFTMYGGVISGNKATAGDGGGVIANSASINLIDGTISGNVARWNGGGLLARNSAFVMTDGSISGNSSDSGAGIYLTQSSVFTMNDGSITGNTATAGGGIYAIDGSTIDMYDGEISDNTATAAGGGIEMNSPTGTFTMHGGTVSGNEVTSGLGGGILINAAFSANITAGTISGNTASGLGGGVYVGGSTPFVMRDVDITGNAATAGGGIYFANGSKIDIYSGTISDNTATAAGGGIEMNAGAGVFTMHGGVISGNEVTSGSGGGILISAASSVNMLAGAINNNKASGSGGGVYVGGSTPFVVQGGEIDNNNATNGGGVYVTATATLNMMGGKITRNAAALEGGGIYTENYSYINFADTSKYSNITIASGVNVSGNTAQTEPLPSNASAFTNFDGTLLTNNQINYRYRNVLTYNPNGGTGTAVAETYTSPQTVAIKSPTNAAISFVAMPGYEFEYWSDNPGGVSAGGLRYEGDGTGAIHLNQSKTLYAVWGLITQGRISGYVFEDKNENGAYDAGEGLAGRVVRLYKEVGGTYIDTMLVATTNADGMYEFDVGMNENYKVLFDVTDGTTEFIAKGTAATSSHVNSTGFSDVIEIGNTAATKNKVANAGYVADATGGGTTGGTGGAETGNAPQTGDAANMLVWIFLMAASACALVALLFVRRRIQKCEK